MAVNITLTGNVTNDPELRFTGDGTAVASFNVANNTPVLDRATNQWKDGNTTFYRVSVWRDQAQNVNDTLKKGQRVIVIGKLSQKEYQGQDGTTRQSLDVVAEEVAPSLRWAKGSLEKVAGGGNAGATGSVPTLNNTGSVPVAETAPTTDSGTAPTGTTANKADEDPWANAVDPDF